MTIEYRLQLETRAHKQNPITYFGKVLDLKDELQETREAYHKLQALNSAFEMLPDSIEIEEFVDLNGKLKSIVEETTWLESMNRLTGKDFRIIVGFDKQTFPSIGLYTVDLVGVEKGHVKDYQLKLWIVPIKDEETEVSL